MSSEKFESIEDDLQNVLQDIRRKIEIRLPKAYGEEKKLIVREIERNVYEANLMLQDLEADAKIAPHPFRSQLLNKTRNYSQTMRDLDKKFQSLKNPPSQARLELMNNFASGSAFDQQEVTSRGRLLIANQAVERTSESIARSQVVAAETDQIGTEIIEELGTQRESLIRTKERLTDTDENLSKSRKILKSMYRRVITNKLILIVLIILEFGILGGVVYWKFFT